MKQFNVLNNQQIIEGLLMPKNCVYGHIDLKYTAKIDTGKIRVIHDKNGYPVYNQDGTEKVRKVWRNEQRTQSVTYCVMDLKPHKFGNEHAFYAWIKTPGGRWHETPLVRNAWMRELNNFISRKISAHCAQAGTTLVNMFMACNATPKVNNTHEVAVAATHRREVMRTSVYEGRWGYAVNPNIITDGVHMKDTPIKGVIASHKGAFGTKAVYDPAKASAEDARIPKFGYTAEGVRVVFSKKNAAHETAIYHGNGHFVAGNGAELERTQNMGKDLHEVAAAEYWDKPRKAPKPELKGKEPTFRKFVETPTGIRRFYNEQEYNDYVSAQAVVDAHKPAPKKRKTKIIIVTQAR